MLRTFDDDEYDRITKQLRKLRNELFIIRETIDKGAFARMNGCINVIAAQLRSELDNDGQWGPSNQDV